MESFTESNISYSHFFHSVLFSRLSRDITSFLLPIPMQMLEPHGALDFKEPGNMSQSREVFFFSHAFGALPALQRSYHHEVLILSLKDGK
jgi:hypothetical protein